MSKVKPTEFPATVSLIHETRQIEMPRYREAL